MRREKISGYRFQPQRQRHILEDTLEASDHEKKDTREAERTQTKLAETVSTGGGAEPICWCGDKFVCCHEMAATRQRAEHIDEGKY